MAEAPIWPVATDAFIADTTHLDAEQTGAYMMLLMSLWRSPGAKLPMDDKKLCRMARVSPRRWPVIWSVISEFFTVKDGFVAHNRVTSDRVKVREKIEVARQHGAQGGKAKARKTNTLGIADATNPLEKKPSGTVAESYQPINHKPDPERKNPPLRPPKGDKARRTGLPDGFPDEACREPALAYWRKRGRLDLDFDIEAQKFRASVRANGRKYIDWPAAWQTWYANAVEFNRPGIKAASGFGGIFDDLRSRGVME